MKTKRIASFLTLVLLFSAFGSTPHGQQPAPPTAARREMAKLKFLVGNWRGEGWMEFGPGQRQPFTSGEEVQLKLDGVLLLIEGIHSARFPGQTADTKIHHAVAAISYGEATKDYQVQAHKADGKSMAARGEFKDGAFIWGFNDPGLGHLRFTIRLNKQGQWHEIGERSRDGKTWTQYLEMTLSKAP